MPTSHFILHTSNFKIRYKSAMVNPWDFSVLQIIAVAGLGLVAGTLGGMLGGGDEL